MKNAPNQSCEVKVDGEWRAVSLAEALTSHRLDTKRCPLCHGQVMTVGAYTSDRRPSLAHRKAHDGCPHQPRFTGTPTPHPQALV